MLISMLSLRPCFSTYFLASLETAALKSLLFSYFSVVFLETTASISAKRAVYLIADSASFSSSSALETVMAYLISFSLATTNYNLAGFNLVDN